jgi:hypothetical protein
MFKDIRGWTVHRHVTVVAVTGLALLATGSAAALAATPTGSGFPGAPRSQHFTYGSNCPAAPANRYLTTPAGCLTVRFADVDGDGRADLVLLYTKPGVQHYGYRFTLKVDRASGGTLTSQLPEGDIPATIARLRNVNGRPGAELFIHYVHVTTAESMAIYSFNGNRLQRSGVLSYGGYDSGLKFGFTCRTGQPPQIVEDQFARRSAPGHWAHTATTYVWSGSALNKTTTHTTTFVGASPPPRQVGAHC